MVARLHVPANGPLVANLERRHYYPAMQLRIISTVLAVLAVSAGASPGAQAGSDAKLHRLTLDEAIALAQANELTDAARAATAAARARTREARGARIGAIEMTSFVAPSPEIRCADELCTQTEPREVTINIAGLFAGIDVQMVQPLFTFGKLDAVSAAAEKAAEMAAHGEDQLAGDLAYQTARAYYGLKLARELRWMLEDGKEQIEKGRVTLQERLDEGAEDVTIQDRLRLETFAAEVGARLTEARAAEGEALAALRGLTGESAAEVDEEPLEPVGSEFQDSVDPYIGRAESKHPQLAAARAGVASLDALARYEKARYWPDLVLVGGVRVARAQGVDDAPSAFANDPFNITSARLGLALRWRFEPLSQAARVARVQAEKRRASALMAAASKATEWNVRRVHERAKQAKERLTVTKEGLRSARGWVASVLQADAIGTASAKDLADAYLALFTVQSRVLYSTYDWNLALIDLRRAVGEYQAKKTGS